MTFVAAKSQHLPLDFWFVMGRALEVRERLRLKMCGVEVSDERDVRASLMLVCVRIVRASWSKSFVN